MVEQAVRIDWDAGVKQCSNWVTNTRIPIENRKIEWNCNCELILDLPLEDYNCITGL